MSKIRTSAELNDHLSQDLAWRKIELSALRGLIESRSLELHKNKVLTRSGIAILYAHWEGYIKCAATAYLEFVSRQKQYRYCDLTDNFVAIAMKNKLDEASNANQPVIHNEVIKFLIESMEQRIEIPRQGIIKTGSNLSSSVLRQILALLGIDYQPYEMKQILIDEKLLEKRNKIAHGEFLDVDVDSYRELHKEVIDMMDLFKDQIENHVEHQLYLRLSVLQTPNKL
jgi:MAE_28990/MAE_18760-like HEPN